VDGFNCDNAAFTKSQLAHRQGMLSGPRSLMHKAG
jgi:hypothetical protein